MTLTVKDLEKIQERIPDHRLELVDGEVIVMSPSGYESDEVASEFSAQLRNWVRPRKLGRITGRVLGLIYQTPILVRLMCRLCRQSGCVVALVTLQN